MESTCWGQNSLARVISPPGGERTSCIVPADEPVLLHGGEAGADELFNVLNVIKVNVLGFAF